MFLIIYIQFLSFILYTTKATETAQDTNEVKCGRDHSDMYLSCDQQLIIISYANWGRTQIGQENNKKTCPLKDPSKHTLVNCTSNSDFIKSKCNGRNNCILNTKMFITIYSGRPDPCSGTYKYLNISWYCGEIKADPALSEMSTTANPRGSWLPSEGHGSNMEGTYLLSDPALSKSTTANPGGRWLPSEGHKSNMERAYPLPDTDNRIIVCPDNRTNVNINCGDQSIDVTYANWGRTQPGIDGNRRACPNSNPSKHKTTNCISSSDDIRSMCHGKHKCTLKISNFIPKLSSRPDPCKGTYKYLNVSWRCKKIIEDRATTVLDIDFSHFQMIHNNTPGLLKTGHVVAISCAALIIIVGGTSLVLYIRRRRQNIDDSKQPISPDNREYDYVDHMELQLGQYQGGQNGATHVNQGRCDVNPDTETNGRMCDVVYSIPNKGPDDLLIVENDLYGDHLISTPDGAFHNDYGRAEQGNTDKKGKFTDTEDEDVLYQNVGT